MQITKAKKATKYTLSNRSREKRGEGEEYRQSVIAEFTDYEEARRSAKARLNQPKARRVLFLQSWNGSEYLKEYTIKRPKRDRMKYENGTPEGEAIDLVYAMIEEERRQRKEAAKRQAAVSGRPFLEIVKEENAKHRPDELRRMAEARRAAKALIKYQKQWEAEQAAKEAEKTKAKQDKEAKRQANRERFQAEQAAKEAERLKAKEAKRQANRERFRAEQAAKEAERREAKETKKKAAQREKEAKQ